MRLTPKFLITSLVVSLCFGTSLFAQYQFQSSWIMAEEGRAQQVFFGAKTLMGVDVTFSNLGEMPYIQGDDSAYTHQFNDGYIDLPFDDSEFTTRFAFDYSNAVEGPDGEVESFSLTRYRSAGIGESYTKNMDFSTGWELGSHYDMWKLSNRVTMGFTIAGGFTPLRASYHSTEIKGELYRQTVTVPLSGPAIDYTDSGYYIGSSFAGPYILLDDLNFDASVEDRVSQILADGSIVLVDALIDGTYELLGGIGTIRTGTYLDIYLTERLLVHLGVGFLASYLSYDFTVDQSLITSTLASSYRIKSNINEGQWLVGGYAELNLVYRVNPKTSIYAGAQGQFMQDFEGRSVDDMVMDIRMGTSTQLQAGFEFDF